MWLPRVREMDANAVALGAANRRAGHLAVVRPRRVEHTGRDLDLAIVGDDRVLAQRLPVRQARDGAVIEMRQERRRVELARARARRPRSWRRATRERRARPPVGSTRCWASATPFSVRSAAAPPAATVPSAPALSRARRERKSPGHTSSRRVTARGRGRAKSGKV